MSRIPITPRIPITRDYAKAVGDWCEKVENRSLLLDKCSFHKFWGHPPTEDGSPGKEDNAYKWSLLRIASNGAARLKAMGDEVEKEAGEKKKKGKIRDSEAKRMRDEAAFLRKIAKNELYSGLKELLETRASNFLDLFHENYSPCRLRIVYAELEGRLAINLAEGLIENAGISLDRIFGLPLIPGSAVKGAARAAALAELNAEWKQNPARPETIAKLDALVRVFGVGDNDWKTGDLAGFEDRRGEADLPRELKGAVNFIQAMPVDKAEIVVDIVNVHYPRYYQGKERDAKDSENPVPNYFPAVERGAVFAFPLLLNGMKDDPKLLDAAGKWLLAALTQNGLGAKTAAGYGWFSDVTSKYRPEFDAERQARLAKEKTAREVASAVPDEALVERFMAMKDNEFLGALNKYKHEEEEYWPRDHTPVYRRSLLEAAMRKNPAGKDSQKAIRILTRLFEGK